MRSFAVMDVRVQRPVKADRVGIGEDFWIASRGDLCCVRYGYTREFISNTYEADENFVARVDSHLTTTVIDHHRRGRLAV